MSEEVESTENVAHEKCPENILISDAEEVPGVNLKFAQAIENLLRKGRRKFGDPGAFYTYQKDDPDYRNDDTSLAEIAKHLEAEKDTSARIMKWAEDKPSVVVVNSIAIPGRKPFFNKEAGVWQDGYLSHAVIFGEQMIMIDSLGLAKKKTYGVTDDGDITMTGKPFAYSKQTIGDTYDNWFDYLVGDDLELHACVMVNSPEAKTNRLVMSWHTAPFHLIEADRFEEYLWKKWDESTDEMRGSINTSIVSQLVAKTLKPYNPYKRVFSPAAAKGFI